MTNRSGRIAIPITASLVFLACGIDSETSGTLATNGGSAGTVNGNAGRAGSFVGEPGGTSGIAGKSGSGTGAGASSTGAGAGGGTSAGGKAGSASSAGKGGAGNAGSSVGGGTGGTGNGGASVGGTGGLSSTGGNAGSSGTGGSGTSAGAGGTTGQGGQGSAGASSTGGGSGGTSPIPGGRGGVAGTGGTGPLPGGAGGAPTGGGAGGDTSVAGAGGFVNGGGFGTGGRAGAAGGGPGPVCGNGKVEKGEECDPGLAAGNPRALECSSDCKECPGLLHVGTCYFVPKEKKTVWEDAAKVCAEHDAELSSPSITEFGALAGSPPPGKPGLPGKDEILWAAVRQAEDAKGPKLGWTWRAGSEDGEEVNSLNWSTSEPNDLGHTDEQTPGEDCGAVIRSRGFKYDDKVCESEYAVLCERSWPP